MSTTFWLCSKGHQNHPTRDRCGVRREKRLGAALPIPAEPSRRPWYRTREWLGVAALGLAALLVLGTALWSEHGPTSPRAQRAAANSATEPALRRSFTAWYQANLASCRATDDAPGDRPVNRAPTS